MISAPAANISALAAKVKEIKELLAGLGKQFAAD